MSDGHDSFPGRARTLAKAARRLNAHSAHSWDWPLAFMTDAVRGPDAEAVAEALPKDAAVILRDYEAPERALRAQRLVQICKRRGLLFLAGADLDLAEQVGAGGVHLPERLAVLIHEARTRRPEWIVTVACHSAAALKRAALFGAHAALLSPVFETGSHPGAMLLGAAQFTTLCAGARLPVLALGGVNETNAKQLSGSGCAGFAAISAFGPKGAAQGPEA